MIGVQFEETISRSHAFAGLAFLVARIGDIELRLLRIAAKRILGF